MKTSKKILTNKNFIYIFLLTMFSVTFNQYYGYQGILPIDSFLIFNSGYDLLNGNYPFKDYWTIKEPFIDFLQAIIFYIFGISWFSYVLHASIFNLIITLSTFFILKKFRLNINLCFFYSVCVAILTYPTAGTPFSDHHTLILCVISLYLFFIAVKFENKFIWFLIPLFLGFSFLSKQAPTAYFVILISVLSIVYFALRKNYIDLLYAFFGFIFILSSFFLLLFLAEINFNDFLIQYILFPQSLGSSRLEWVFPLEFNRFVLRYKLHYLSISVFFILLIKNFIFKSIKLKISDLLIIISLIFSCLIFIFHQLMTINQMFIYCMIPIFSGFSHVYYNLYFNKKFVGKLLFLLTFCSTIYYFINDVHNRSFMDLKNVNLLNAVDGELIDKNLKGVQWITMFYPKNPMIEVDIIKNAIEIINKDEKKKMIITDYQFISVFQNQYDYSVTRFWYEFHGYPDKENEYYDYWKNFVLKKIAKNNLKVIYVLKPLHGDERPLENVLENCFQKVELTEKLYKLELKNC